MSRFGSRKLHGRQRRLSCGGRSQRRLTKGEPPPRALPSLCPVEGDAVDAHRPVANTGNISSKASSPLGLSGLLRSLAARVQPHLPERRTAFISGHNRSAFLNGRGSTVARHGRLGSSQMQKVQVGVPRTRQAAAERLFAAVPDLRSRRVLRRRFSRREHQERHEFGSPRPQGVARGRGRLAFADDLSSRGL